MEKDIYWLLESYKQKGMQYLLENNEKKTLNALLQATENHIISPYNADGNTMWKETLEYCQKNMSRGIFAIMEERLYEFTSSLLQQDLLTIFADFSAAIAKGLTFGMAPAVSVVSYVRGRVYNRHIKKLF